MWRQPKEAGRPGSGDETVLPVDISTEEIYESRVYPLLPHPGILILLASRLAREQPQPTHQEFFQVAQAVFAESTLKLLAKRSRSDGRISYLVTIVSEEVRAVFDRGDVPDEAGYRRVVGELEADLLEPGMIGEPLVVTPEEWRRYELEQE